MSHNHRWAGKTFYEGGRYWQMETCKCGAERSRELLAEGGYSDWQVVDDGPKRKAVH